MQKLFGWKYITFIPPTILIVASMLIATCWVFLVPIFQSQDEDLHTDYVFTLYSRRKIAPGKSAPIVAISHPYVSYLLQTTNGQAVKWNPFVAMPANYGTKQFYQDLDRYAPGKNTIAAQVTNPLLMHVYPIGYYAIAALWLALLSNFNTSLSFLFFATRLFSVFLMGIGLSMSYLTMREISFPRWKSLLILAIISFFPLTTFIGSYIQPHNLAFAAISTCFYLAIRWRNKPDKTTLSQLGLALATLLLSKYQFFLCAALAITSMIFAKETLTRTTINNRIRSLAILLIPSLIAGIFQLFIFSYCNNSSTAKEHTYWFPFYTHSINALTQTNKSPIQPIISALSSAYSNTFSPSGLTFKSFWGLFGWGDTPLIIYNIPTNDNLRCIIQIFSITILLLTFACLVKVTTVLIRLVRKKHLRTALYLLSKNPIINSYFLFVLLIIALTIIGYPDFISEGRQWFPLILPIVLSATTFTSLILPKKKQRQQYFLLVATCWLFYSLIASYYALICIYNRYYCPEIQNIIDPKHLESSSINAPCTVEMFNRVELQPSLKHHNESVLTVPSGIKMRIWGWAIDAISDSPASAVLIYVDNKFLQQAIYGIESPKAIETFKNNTYRFSGFAALIPTEELSTGEHILTIKVISKNGRVLYQTNTRLKFIVQ